MVKLSRYLSAGAAACICLTVALGCSMRPAPLSEQEQLVKRDEFIAAGGYSVAGSYEIESVGERWWHEGKALDTVLLAPRKPGNYPLVIYLPALGESADAGRLWREYWAKAGYAVLSVQAEDMAKAFADLTPDLPEKPPRDEGLFDVFGGEEPLDDGSEDGKNMPAQAVLDGDRRYIGHGFFTQESLNIRIGHLLWAYGQCQQRAHAKQGLFAQVDPAKVILVGYDIGADTAAGLLTGQANDGGPAYPLFQPLAAMLLSPVVAASSGDMRERYQRIRLPLLVVGSDQDSDKYAITTPQLRKFIWDYAASRNKYLLWLKSAQHALFSGSEWTLPGRGERGPGGRGSHFGGPPPDFAGHFQGEGGRRGGPPGGMGGGPGPNRRDAADRVATYQQIGAVLSVSTAFFDSIGKSDNFAELWLRQNAPAWLQPVARLTGS